MANGIELAKAYVQIVPSATGIKKSLETELSDAGDSAGKKGGEAAGSGFGEKFGSALKSVASIAASAMAGAATAISALATDAIKNFSDYEQLTGGVETLFGNSYAVVMHNAENAFKTAGMSANEYMETVTSFSASLLQGLGGDTFKAAKIADQALTDMSDNANKMGTSMESIQNAYQGFAKQNYTMLDNLKLGYGGTQAEMVRLINDSGVLNETIESMDGVSFDTIINAIHQVQNNLGITGTTALEASSTIQGSIGQMSAAWTNFITGMADEKQDFNKLLNNLVDSVETVAANLAPRIMQTLPRLVQGLQRLIEKLLPEVQSLISELLPALVTGAKDLIKAFSDELPGIIGILKRNLSEIIYGLEDIMLSLGEALISAAPELAVMAIDALVYVGTAIGEMALTMIPEVVGAIMSVLETLLSNDTLSRLTEVIMTLAWSLVTAVLESLPVILNGVMKIIDGLLSYITENIDYIVKGLVDIILQVTNFLLKSIPKIMEVGVELFSALLGALPEILKNLCAAIPDLIDGLISAILENIPIIIDTGLELITNLVTALPEIIQAIVSVIPDIIKGIVNTLMNNIPLIIETGINVLMSLVKALPEIITGICNAVPEIMDSLADAFIEMIPLMIDVGIKMLPELVEGFVKALPQVLKAIPNIFKAIIDGIWNVLKSIVNIGVNLVKGLWEGIHSAAAWLWEKISGWISGIWSGIKNFFGIHSPSTEMAWIGEMLDKGLAEGIEDNVRPVENAMDSIVKATTGSIDSEIAVNGALGVNTSSEATNQLGTLINIVSVLSQKVENMQIVLDSGVLVGTVDSGIGASTSMASRGVAMA